MDFMIPFEEILEQFAIKNQAFQARELSGGKINRTFLITVFEPDSEKKKKYILQQINTSVFSDPLAVLGNAAMAADCLSAGRTYENHRFPVKHPAYMKSRNGAPFYANGSLYYRLYPFVSGRILTDLTDEAQAGALGIFAANVEKVFAGADCHRFADKIPGFHDVVTYYEKLEQAVNADSAGRRELVGEELAYLMEIREEASGISLLCRRGELPVRIVHNDMKLENFLWSETLPIPDGILDLDSVMPGSILFDYADMRRSMRKHHTADILPPMLKAFSQGFTEMAGDLLTPREQKLLPVAEFCVSAELATRYLADYLNGDVYFKTTQPDDNLRRARDLIRTLKRMEH